jgi:hypothetical protein
VDVRMVGQVAPPPSPTGHRSSVDPVPVVGWLLQTI